jgi:multicomponent Na+:H+ antiporter subunit D
VFFQRDSGLRPKDAPWNMGVAMVIFSVLCILFGVAPQLLYDYLPYPVDYEAYTAGKVIFYLQLLLFSGLAFFLLLPLMRRTETISLDADWLWRVALFRLWSGLYRLLAWLGAKAGETLSAAGRRLGRRGQRWFGSETADGRRVHGVFARAWPIGTTALWIAVLLTAYVFFYYLD